MDSLIKNPGLSTLATNIIMYLNTASLARCRQVCHLWFDFINDQMFWWVRVLKLMNQRPFMDSPEWEFVIQSIQTDKDKLRHLMTILLNYRSKDSDYTPLHFAAESGDLDDIELLFSFEDLVCMSHRSKRKRHLRPIHYATLKGHIEVVRWILYKFKGAV